MRGAVFGGEPFSQKECAADAQAALGEGLDKLLRCVIEEMEPKPPHNGLAVCAAMYIIVPIFFVVIMLYITFADIFTILFRLTGLTDARARFQVVSLLTNSGFTTQESESVLETNIRRSLAKIIMIFGYTFTATIVSGVVSILLSMGNFELYQSLIYLLFILGGFALFIVLRQRRFFANWLDRLINRFYCKHIVKGLTNPVMPVEEFGDDIIADVFVNSVPDELTNVQLSQSDLRSRYELLVLMVKSPKGDTRHGDADTVISKDDVVTVMGRKQNIVDCFNRKEAEKEETPLAG